MRPGIVQSISELAQWVDDLAASTVFYTEKLGFTVESADPGAFLRSGDFYLVQFDRKSPNTQLADEYLARARGPRGDVYHSAFKMNRDELDSLANLLADSGIQVKGPVDFATGRRSFFFEDADEHYIELTDR